MLDQLSKVWNITGFKVTGIWKLKFVQKLNSFSIFDLNLSLALKFNFKIYCNRTDTLKYDLKINITHWLMMNSSKWKSQNIFFLGLHQQELRIKKSEFLPQFWVFLIFFFKLLLKKQNVNIFIKKNHRVNKWLFAIYFLLAQEYTKLRS